MLFGLDSQCGVVVVVVFDGGQEQVRKGDYFSSNPSLVLYIESHAVPSCATFY